MQEAALFRSPGTSSCLLVTVVMLALSWIWTRPTANAQLSWPPLTITGYSLKYLQRLSGAAVWPKAPCHIPGSYSGSTQQGRVQLCRPEAPPLNHLYNSPRWIPGQSKMGSLSKFLNDMELNPQLNPVLHNVTVPFPTRSWEGGNPRHPLILPFLSTYSFLFLPFARPEKGRLLAFYLPYTLM